MNPRSIRYRVISWYAALLGGLFIVLGLAIYLGVEHLLERNLKDALDKRARLIGETIVGEIPRRGEAFVAGAINSRYAPEAYGRLVRVMHSDGRIVYSSAKTQDIDPALVPALHPEGAALAVQVIPGPEVPLLVVARQFSANGDAYQVESGETMRSIESSLRQLRWSLAGGAPLVLAIALAGGWFVVGRSLAPVTEMTASADRITLHRTDERLPLAGTGDELEHLSGSLNRMIERLHEAFDQNRRFIADASHELRTPLAVLRGELESILQQSTSPETRERVGSALEEVERLTRIVEQLFAIARLDAGEAQAEWTRLDLAKLTSSTSEQMLLLAEDKGVTLSCDASHPVWVQGDSARLKQVVVNLLDNAIKYTAKGGTIALTVSTRANNALLEVTDTGIGIPIEAQPHVFERFYRVDKARSRQMGGAGLGLAIVKSICSAHGGHVRVQSQEGRGSRFSVELPAA